jgi:uncharacterized membrane protein YqjE
MAEQDEGRAGGLFASVRRLADSTTKMVQHRLELLSLELQEQKVRLVDVLFRLAMMIVLGILALVTATATVVLLLLHWFNWPPHLTLLGLTLLYGALAVTLGLGIRRQLREEPRPFHDSIEQFKKDREWLDKRNSGASTSARNG